MLLSYTILRVIHEEVGLGVKIFVFYVIFYLFLAGFWSGMLIVFYQTLDEHEPSYKLESSRITGSPGRLATNMRGCCLGMGYRPHPEDASSDFIWYNHTDTEQVNKWVKRMDKFLKGYSKEGPSTKTCDAGQSETAHKNEACFFDAANIASPCNSQNGYGFSQGKPCIVVKLNRIYGWVPKGYEQDKLPSDMPENIKSNYDPTKVYISCNGSEASDRDNMGDIEYLPNQSIASYYFPFQNQKNYMSPLVFIHFLSPVKNQIVQVRCRAWAANIQYNTKDNLGSTQFSLLID
ncbi:ATP1B1 [Cordylochernes scorpioides]|uniref:ATP1B1 n=1 Tax=Cordylochernes scorpioides TaxID=51811 RepID=A0ABY6KND8_9ARAC|nr:ATP1B1 [Cordylochernes scorpioides]